MAKWAASLLVLAVVLGAALASERVFPEGSKGKVLPELWKEDATFSKASSEKKLYFALKQRNLDVLEKKFWTVSDPDHSDRGNFLSLSQLTDIIAPEKASVEKVLAFILSHHVSPHKIQVTQNMDWIVVWTPVLEAEKMLQVSFQRYAFKGDLQKTSILSLDAYSLPSEIAELLDFVGNVNVFSSNDKLVINDEVNPDAIGNVNPAVIKQYYNLPANIHAVSHNSSQAVAEFQGQLYSASDLHTFFQINHLPMNDSTVTKIVGTGGRQGEGVEAELDIQYIMGVAVGVPTWFVYDSAGGFSFMDQVLNWITVQSNTENSPWVHSVSYGQPEREISGSLMTRISTEFQKFGTRGRTVFFASGDSGVGCFFCIEFEPDFCASSPYVTSVGANMLEDSKETGFYISGGGFSKHFNRPSYQSSAVNDYFANPDAKLPGKHFYNRAGRGYPDVSAFGRQFQVVVGGGVEPVAGTSCASPTVAAIFSLINDARFAVGKGPLGFLNQYLYQWAVSTKYGAAFHNIAHGNNGHDFCCPGFNAVAKSAQDPSGWSPMTGLGSPDYANLLQYAMELN